jgi:4-amino-4-deoxy-L-arabinose transferase-like glycosyltransferase
MIITDEPTRTIGPVDPVPAPTRARWELPGLLALLAGTAVLYLWALGSLGWANEFYAAAVQSGTKNWTAWLFGSLDPGNVITVDKPPASLWLMSLSGKLFGFSAWSMLVPQALMGVASVGLLCGAVRRTSGPAAGLLAGALLALTPVAALMFRYNNPDAMLVLLLVVAAYCVVRALDGAPVRWLVFAGTALGFAFLAKLLQAFLIVPVLALVVLVAVPGSVWKRLGALVAGLVAMVISGGWFVALVSLWPADSRPYIGGSTDNSLLELALGYNGLGRVFGGDGNPTGGGEGPGGGGGGGGPGGAMFGGDPGITRMFGESMGTEISWLLPAALIGLLAGLWFTRRAVRIDRTRAGLLLWGGWMVATAVVFSFMKGIMHPYYTIALAPGIAGVVAITTVKLWQGRSYLWARIPLALMLASTGIWNFVLLNRTPDWLPWLRWVVLVGAIIVAAILVVGGHQLGRYTAVLVTAGLLFAGAATAAYTVQTVLHSNGGGGIPTSGPARDGGMDFGGPGGPFGGGGTSDEVKQLLIDADTHWAAATVGSQLSGSLELSTDTSVMAIGGFSGGDDAPSLEQFQQWVGDGQVGYFLTSERGFGGMGGRNTDSAGGQITQWVKDNFTAQTFDGTTVYDLTP